MIRVEELQLGMIAFISDDRPPGIVTAINKEKGKPILSFRIEHNYGSQWRYNCGPQDRVEAYTLKDFLRQFHAKPKTVLAHLDGIKNGPIREALESLQSGWGLDEDNVRDALNEGIEILERYLK